MFLDDVNRLTIKKNNLSLDVGFLSMYDSGLANYLTILLQKKLAPVQDTLQEGRYFLAGGALRCYYENREARDLDLYVLEDKTFQAIRDHVDSTYTKSTSNPCGEIDLGEVGEFGLSDSRHRKDAERHLGPYRCGAYKYPYKHLDYISMDVEGVQFLRVKYVPDYTTRKKDRSLPKRKDLKEEDFITATTATEILEGFDFICCQAGVEFEISKQSIMGTHLQFIGVRQDPQCLTAIARRELRISVETNMQKCGIAYYRLHKYITEYGYRVPTKEDFKLLERMRASALLEGFDPSEEHYGDN